MWLFYVTLSEKCLEYQLRISPGKSSDFREKSRLYICQGNLGRGSGLTGTSCEGHLGGSELVRAAEHEDLGATPHVAALKLQAGVLLDQLLNLPAIIISLLQKKQQH